MKLLVIAFLVSVYLISDSKLISLIIGYVLAVALEDTVVGMVLSGFVKKIITSISASKKDLYDKVENKG